MKIKSIAAVLAACSLVTLGTASVPVATYTFGGNLKALEAGAPDLATVGGAGSFSSASLYGATRSVYDMNGATGAGLSNIGVSLNGSQVAADPKGYSLEMVFSMSERDGAYRKLVDVSNRVDDAGFYYTPSNQLRIYPVTTGSSLVSSNTFYYVALTVDTTGSVSAYLNGNKELTVTTNIMNLDNNSAQLINFFVDDFATGGGEYSKTRVGLIRFTSGVLSDRDIASRANNPYLVPEPSAAFGLAVGLGLLLNRKKPK